MKRSFFTAIGLIAVLSAQGALAQITDPLTEARRAYNDRKFDAAIAAAEQARKVPTLANPAAVVLGRAYLERFQAAVDATDLRAARAAFADVKSELLSPADRTDFLVGLGISLYVDDCIGVCLSAAAEFFDLALAAGGSADSEARESVFEWWATSLDRQAQFTPEEGRLQIYRRVLDRAEAERARDINSASATYWIAAASRGVGDFDRAWGAAVAGWVRAKYFGARGEGLRNDLQRFVYDVLLPERAKQMVPDADPRPQLELLRKQWADITDKYK